MAELKASGIKGFTLKREADKFTASWTVKNSDNCTSIEYKFSLWVNKKNEKTKKVVKHETLKSTAKSASYTLNRNNTFPNNVNASKYKWLKVVVRCINKSGKQEVKHDWQERWYEFNAPAVPTLGAISLSKENSKITVSSDVTMPSGAGHKDRYWLRHTIKRILVQNKKIVSSVNLSGHNDDVFAKGSTLESSSISYGETNIDLPNDGDHIKYEFSCYAQGIAGRSDKKSTPEREYYIGWAANLNIESIVLDKAQNNVLVNIFEDVNSLPKETPTTSVKLQYVHTTSNDLDGVEWLDVDNTNDNLESTKQCSVEDLKKSYVQGEKIWVRLVTSNVMESMRGYSEPKEVGALYVPAADQQATTDIDVVSATAGTDGDSIMAVIGWQDDSYSGTTLSWSTDQDVWKSNTDPDTFSMTDAKWKDATSQASDYANSCAVKIKSLEENTTYYLRARRYDTGTEDNYGAWSKNIAVCTTGTMPVGVTLSAPSTATPDADIAVAWTLGGDKPQTNWQLVAVGYTDKSEDIVIASGSDSASVCSVPMSYLIDRSDIALCVKASNGGDYYTSNTCVVAIKQAPTITVSAERIITDKGWAFTVTGNADTQLDYKLISAGATSAMPDDTQEQYDSDIIWSDSSRLTGDGSVAATIELPDTVYLIDGCAYQLQVTPTYDGVTGNTVSPKWEVTEDEVTYPTYWVTVDWSHKAIAPTDVVITSDDTKAAAITVNAPDGAATNDVFNVYRLTPDGTYLIAQDVAFGSTVTDRWSPYGTNNLEYRIATKTINNDYAWDDFPYTNSGKALRFDWEGGSVELPYNISINDSWEKDFEGVKYLDGTKSGYWNEGAARTSSLSTDVIRIKDAETERAVRELAKYTGSVFVRTPTGQAYEANVTVSADMTYDSSALSVSLDTEEIECVTYVCDSSDITGSEG